MTCEENFHQINLSLELSYLIFFLQEPDLLIKIPGIGKKTAERLVLELKDKFNADQIKLTSDKEPTILDDIQNALIALGYSSKDVITVTKELASDISLNDGIRQALKLLSKNL